MDVLNETLTFEDGVKLKEDERTKEPEDYPEEASGKQCCSDAGTSMHLHSCGWEGTVSSAMHLQLSPQLPRLGPPGSPQLCCLCPPPRARCSDAHSQLSPPPLLSPWVVSPAPQLQVSQPAAPHVSVFLTFCWKCPRWSPTSISNSAWVPPNLRVLPSQ